MEKILARLDESVFTDELKTELQESFDAAVDAKVIELVAEKTEEKTKELEEMAEAFKEKLAEEANAEKEAFKTSLMENLDEFLDLIASEYVEQNKIAIEESVKGEQLEALLEGFNAMMVAGGVELKEIQENTTDSVMKGELAESKEKVDALVAENMELKKEKATLLKMGLVMEAKAGMTELQKEKFDKLANVVEFDVNEANEFIDKLEVIAESVKSQEEGEFETTDKADKKVKKDTKDGESDAVGEDEEEEENKELKESAEEVEGSKLDESYADSKRFF